MDPGPEVHFDLNKTLQIILRKMRLIIVTLFLVVIFRSVFNELSAPIFKASTIIIFEELHSLSDSITSFNISRNKDLDIIQIELRTSQCLTVEIFKALPKNTISTSQLPNSTNPGFNKEVYITDHVNDRISVNSIHK